MASRVDSLDLEHSLLAMRSFGRFHALSVCLTETGLLTTEEFTRSIFSGDGLVEIMLNAVIPKLIEAIKCDWPTEW